MAIRIADEYVEFTAPDADYPGGSFKNETIPGALDGTPLDNLWGNDLLGILQKLLAVAGITPSGVPDTVQASDYFDAMNKIFSGFTTHVDTGAANAFVLDSASGADIEAYADGQEVLFLATNGNPGGASTIDTAGLGVISLKLPGGAALPVDAVASGQYVRAVYRSAGPRYEILNIASGITFDDSGVGYTAATVQAALAEVVKRANGTGTQALGTITGHNLAAHTALGLNVSLVGEIKNWPLAAVPSDYFECDGSAISRTTYATLFAVLGTTYGVGDGSTTFNIPDFRGEFLRGWDHGKGTDPDTAGRTDRGDGTAGDQIGTKQLDAGQEHLHYNGIADDVTTDFVYGGTTNEMPGSATRTIGNNVEATTNQGLTSTAKIASSGTPRESTETRPRNINIMYIIKYQ